MPAFFLLLYRFFGSLWNGMKDKDFRNLFLWLLTILIFGSWFYSRVEGWTFLDSFYFSITTLITVDMAILPRRPLPARTSPFSILSLVSACSLVLLSSSVSAPE